MQPASAAYEAAINGSTRRIVPRAVIDLISPDTVYTEVSSSGETVKSKPDQLHNKIFEATPPNYVTLEANRWLLNGEWMIMPDSSSEVEGEQGIELEGLSNASGELETYAQLNFENVTVLQGCSIFFAGYSFDGIATDFRLDVYAGNTIMYTQTVTGNTKNSMYFEGFTVDNPTAIRFTFTKWSLPHRRARAVEIVAGIYETWTGTDLYSVDVLQETAFDCMTTPYGTCTLIANNQGKRFNPYNKSGVFKSIEARQGVPLQMGVELEDGSIEYKSLGTYYQSAGGWETSAYGSTFKFRLVDIVGLIVNRKPTLPETLPTNLDGWLSLLVSTLGVNFANRYIVDEDLKSLVLTAVLSSVETLTCGAILRCLCMAAGAYFYADNETGFLRVSTLPESRGVFLDLNAMTRWVTNEANKRATNLTFHFGSTDYVIEADGAGGDIDISVTNPFITTAEQAEKAAKHVLQFYGGSLLAAYGRGDMRCELGDIDTVNTGFGTMTTGRRYKQQFRISNGIMKDVPSYFYTGKLNA